ncbi:helix-turn-helix transcriptional regulator, partial [Acinetobacter indicus]
LSSVRTYFKNIYEKTECTSQIELMHLLMGCTIHFEHIG